MLQPRNGLHIQSWYADPDDMALALQGRSALARAA